MKNHFSHDVLIIGSGAAGLSLSLLLPDSIKIALVTKERLKDSATYFAQGGISAVLDKDDSFDSHINDTLNTGGGLCNPDVVRFIVENAPKAIEWLISKGVPFSKDNYPKPEYHLNREGGHSHRRIIHVADATGSALEKTLESKVLEKANIDLFEHHIAIDLITQKLKNKKTCVGAYILNKAKDKTEVFSAKHTVLATGGAGKVYLYTSNPDVSNGDGIAMAWRAGCRVQNMEFIQFHPTCLYHPDAKSFLITEAIRGEGGKLHLSNGKRFMKKYDPRGELAPRDIVARAIDNEMKRMGADCVYLDISHKNKDFILDHFPTVYSRCLNFGIDITREPIPVVPAAHYICGGVITDTKGNTDINELTVIGEMASTGLHGANRMASNSLMECVVLANSASLNIEEKLKNAAENPTIAEWDETRVTCSDEEVVVSHNWEEIRRFMWDYVGIVRSSKRLQRAKNRVDLLTHEIAEYYGNFKVTSDLIELRNLVLVADLIIRSAQNRTESRGLHFSLDYPEKNTNPEPENTILIPEK